MYLPSKSININFTFMKAEALFPRQLSVTHNYSSQLKLWKLIALFSVFPFHFANGALCIMTRQQGFERNEDDKKHKRTFKVEKCDLKQSTEKKKDKTKLKKKQARN